MAETLKAACVQMTSGPDIQDNLKQAAALIREAAGQGAAFVATPENTCHMRSGPDLLIESAQTEADHPGIPLFSELAVELGIHLLIGSMAIKLNADKLANRSFVFAPDGRCIATYDKIHMFDVSLSDDRTYKESNRCKPGEQAVLADIAGVKAGLSICYDLRFAYLYRTLAQNGAQMLLAPAAFTVPTGRAHWEVLLRARAIETGSYVLAPAQFGEHEGGRRTWGHSMIINPWGEIIAEKAEGPGIITALLNFSAVEKARSAIPALQHDRTYKIN